MKTLIAVAFILMNIPLFSQEDFYDDPNYQHSVGYRLTPGDFAVLGNVPLLPLPENYFTGELPVVVDNSLQKFFRPIFTQGSYPNCMQATSIAYNFTYEINRLRDLSSDIPDNQYVTHFAWNFYNGGHGWFGVNYLHTFNVLKECGTPSTSTYGGFYEGGGERWMSGYDNYLQAMQNRLEAVYAIPVGTEEGILALKQWLHNHHEGSDVGGVASFIACSPWTLSKLPDGSPEEGKYVIAEWCDMALHGMTIIGYNDSIRYDYNGDGEFTNDVDLNQDGILDVRDWEIGGFKFANSYDSTWADQGYSYMMYKTVADPLSEGGIWGNVVHVLKPRMDYMPEVSLKVGLKHNSREMIRVRAGISYDTSLASPSVIREFPVFNFQGGDMYMQGNDSIESNQYIEFGLDVTSLLSHIEPGKYANFFLLVDEKDEKNKGYGEIVSFSLIDHSDGSEIACSQSNVPLNNNYTTTLAISASLDFEKPEITTLQLPAFVPGVAYEHTMQATGGTPPYKWNLQKVYDESYDLHSFPVRPSYQAFPNAQNDTVIEIQLGFEFPYYGKVYDRVYASAFGFLFFEEDLDYWPYTWKQKEFFKSIKCIAPIKSKSLASFSDMNDGLWYETNGDEAVFFWDNSSREKPYSSDIVFALKITGRGDIEFFYDEIAYEREIEWAGGISEGNNMNFQFVDYSDPREIEKNARVVFRPKDYPSVYEISDEGLLSLYSGSEHRNFDVDVAVTDQQGLVARRSFVFTDELFLDVSFHDDNDTVIEYGETLWADLILRNVSSGYVDNLTVVNVINDPFIAVLDDVEDIGSIAPGQTISIENAFRYEVFHEIPDRYTADFELRASDGNISWERDKSQTVKAPNLVARNIRIIDGQNQRLDPGEDCTMEFFIQNNGHATTGAMYLKLKSLSPYVEITGLPGIEKEPVAPGKSYPVQFDITADASVPNGYFIELEVEMNDQKGLTTRDTIEIMVGRMPVLILDLDPNSISGLPLKTSLEELGVPYIYAQGFPENDLSENQLIFLCLGKHFASHELTWQQGSLLAAFLNNGGRLYMEGRVTWQDEWTPVHGMFSLGIIDQPTMFETIRGADSTFLEGIQFVNSATPPFAYYYFNPSPPAFTVFRETENQYACGVAFETATYKTLAAIFEFGALVEDSTTRTELMSELLEFFEVRYSVASINEHNGEGLIGDVICYPNPFSDITTISFNLQERAMIDLKVYNMHGQLVSSLLGTPELYKGRHHITWNVPAGLPGGLYFYSLSDGQSRVSGKMLLKH